jgi:FkbM family methyltransferase
LAARLGGALFAGLRHVGRTRPGRAILTRPKVEEWVAVAIEAGTVRQSARFFLREARGRQTLERYELRSSGRPVYVRHSTGDRSVLHEIYYEGHYDLPAPVAAYLDGLDGDIEILDLGANIGLFGILMLARFPQARITGFEPDGTNAEVHRRSMAENDREGRWKLVQAAASNRDGRVSFLSGEFARSRIAAGTSTGEVDAVDVFPYLERAAFAKIDTEGGEWAILGDERFASLPTPVLVLEYHEDLCPEPDPRPAALAALRSAGYETSETWSYPGQGMVWAWKPELQTGAAG